MRSQVVSQDEESMLLLAEQYEQQHREQQPVHSQAEMHHALQNSQLKKNTKIQFTPVSLPE